MSILKQGNTNSSNRLSFGGSNRLEVIMQTELAECGLACLAMVAGYYGYDTDLASLRSRFSISSHGTNLKQLMDMAGRMNLSPRALRAELDETKQLQLPCILHWGMNHFVVLKKITKNGFIVHDPALGELSLDREAFSNHFTGIALELTPTRSFKKAKEKRTLRLTEFWSKIVGLKRSLAQVIFLSIILQVFGVLSPYYMQTVVDDVIPRADLNLLLVLAIGFGLLLLIELGTNALRQFVVLHLSSRLSLQMSANLFRHLIRLPMDYFGKRHVGDIVSRFSSLHNVREMFTTGLVTAVVDGLMAFITLIVMFYYDAKITFIVLGFIAIYALLRWLLYRPMRLLTEESIVASAKENSHFIESVRAIQTIKIFQRENSRHGQWQNRLTDVLNKNIKITKWNIGYSTINGFLFGLEHIIVIYFAATAVIDNEISLGMLYAYMSYRSRFVSSMDGLISKFIEFKMIGLHLNRLADIAYTDAEDIDQEMVHPNLNTQSNSTIQGDIEVKNLSFSYGETEAPVFDNLSFKIEAGETVALIGPSGCGKTTLMKCLMGLLKPTSGKILLDGKPLESFPEYRSQIAAVMQEELLLNGDISENIACFEPKIDHQKIQHCANLARVHEEIMKMPMNYNTLVGDMGNGLSGGQKQRIVLARALYREPKILFMDEATSHLDAENETAVSKNIKGLNTTRILAAHRIETIESADRKIDLGKLKETGK